MSSQKGNVKRSRPQKYKNKTSFKNVYHDTSKQTQSIVNTDVTGVCARCKDCIDWKIKYKKYKPLTQAKTCASCKQKTVKLAYHVYCTPCSSASNKCAKCGDKKEIVLQPKLTEAEQASEDREIQFELEQLPERKRRTVRRLQDKGIHTDEAAATGSQYGSKDYDDDGDADDDSDDGSACDSDSIDCEHFSYVRQAKTEAEKQSTTMAVGIDTSSSLNIEHTTDENDSNKDLGETEIAKLNVCVED